jgi:exo-beta-1,3-glucanase (GH17 family)
MSNVHPWFANVSIDQAAAWTANFFETTNVQPAAQLNSTPKFFIAETGWPTVSFSIVPAIVLLSDSIQNTAIL